MFASFEQGFHSVVQRVQQVVRTWFRPQNHSLVLGATSDVLRSHSDLIMENALLRQQLIVVKRQVKRPRFTRWDRSLMVWLTSRLRDWRQTLLLVQSDILLRWHRELPNVGIRVSKSAIQKYCNQS